MDSQDSQKELEGEKYIEEVPIKSSTPDSCVTNTLSCVSLQEGILYGDYEMKKFQGLPQFTLAVIKPDGMKYIDHIEKRMRDEGFDIIQSRKVQLSPEQAMNFYYDHYGTAYFPLLVMSMSEGPISVYVLRRKDAVKMWDFICGPFNVSEAKKKWPESLRAIFGTEGQGIYNVCHASATEEKAREEIRFFFPFMILDENFRDRQDAEDYLKEFVNPTLLEGLSQVCRNKPLNPIDWLAGWLLTHNPYKPKVDSEIALTLTFK